MSRCERCKCRQAHGDIFNCRRCNYPGDDIREELDEEQEENL